MTRRKQNCPKRMKWEGGEGEPPPEGLGDEATPSEDEEEDSVDSSASQPCSPQHPTNPLEPETEIVLRDQTSPSRDSRCSSIPPRCPSRDSEGSDRALPMAPVSPVSLIPPAFLPVMAPHRLVMTSPQGSVSPLVSSSSSPPMLIPATSLVSPRSPPPRSPNDTDAAVLDFSKKRGSDEGSGLDLSKASPVPNSESSPLDLSVSSRKRGQDDSSCGSQSPSPQPRKTPRVNTDFKTVVSPWTSPVVASHFPYFAAAVAAANSLSPKLNASLNSHSSSDSSLWNGKMKDKPAFTPSDATKALEKMSELSKLGGDEFRSMGNSASSGGRHSAWQSHWLNKGADQAKDVLKCVWCKQSFPTLAAMTTHMKEAKHCGVNVPVPNIQPPPPPIPPPTTPTSSVPPVSLPNLSSSGSGKPSPADLNLLIKETMPLPRKLVRGQDVWLGKGAEQTRQILKCMWCGQSFRSLAEMTSHMQQTQHYTNIISQEQIISWKSADEGKSSGGNGGSGGGGSSGNGSSGTVSSAGGASAASSHVSAVLTCKVCDQAFSSLKELSNHMVKNSHYKEHIMRSITESGGRRRQTREKRKKSLPVRKLLELERAQNELKNGEGGMMMMGGKIGREMHSAGRITCEKCGEKIDMAVFVDHIRMCIGGGHISSDQRNLLKSALLSSNMMPSEQHASVTQALRESRKIKKEDAQLSPSATDLSVPPTSPDKDSAKQDGKTSSPSVLNAIEKLIEKSFDSRARHGASGYAGPGGMGQGVIGSSILKRLGIDESVDYTKPLVDPQTMNLLRNYPHHSHGHFGRRERSGSESSSMSERGRTEASTPDRKFDQTDRLMSSTPRTTPEKRIQTPPSAKNLTHDDSTEEDVRIKKEIEDDEVPLESNMRHGIVVKKEDLENGDDEDERRSYHSDGLNLQRSVKEEPLPSPRLTHDEPEEDRRSHNSMVSPGLSPRQPTPIRPSSSEPVPNSPCRNSTSSPASSDRSGTPRSTIEKKTTGSLGALSSMFDNLSGGASGGGASSEPTVSSGKGTSHPLAALQKLCDKTETHHHSSSSGRPSSSNQGPLSMGAGSSQTPQSATTPGAILAFSWACNDAVVTADSIMKCAFCDTPFISKGAYRHHLSKMHFVKDGVIPDPVALKAQAGVSGASPGPHGGKSNNAASTSSGKSPTQQNSFEESPHSKFLKYTELAKQLSSKYV
ncbi:protein tiptop-like [Macrosteles quadrilineatus]|uniref:protein tiptop-like n=1 Tax=Macrosteles quadrilineatus TaxID=74068 RepID=UPI0023E14C63|nr:protein tiptop-like [Macrosteles quadrilineatus]